MLPELSTLPVLFLPGTLCDARVFAALLGSLPAGRAAHVDLTCDVTVGDAAERILASAPPRFIAVGFSLGAIVALDLAARAPARVAAMALIAGNARDVPPCDHAERRAAVSGIWPGMLVGEALWPRYVDPSRLDDPALRALIVAMAEACPAGTAERQTELALSRSDRRSWLPRMDQPVLILSGENDVIAPAPLQVEMAQALPRSHWTTVHDAGHFLLLEQPAACSAAFARWLAQVDREEHRPEPELTDAATDFHALEVS